MVFRWIPAIAITVVSWILSSKEKIPGLPSFFGADKLIHCICFAGLAFWVSFALTSRKNAKAKFCAFCAVAITSIYGIIDEVHQYFTPGRTASVFDWIFDVLGAILGSAIFWAIYRYFCRKNSK